ncbi:MAG TPA: hypothetical protein VI056_10765 [Candidatus Limnocylindria bacterium]
MPLEYVDDLTPAKWIAERLHPFAQDAGAIIPPGFDAYARIFHPAMRRVDQVDVPVRWREIANSNLRVHHSEMQFGAIAGGSALKRGSQPGLWDRPPTTGTLPLDIARVLVGLLRGQTTTPERCWFAAWEGWGDPVFMTSRGSMDSPAPPLPGVSSRPKTRTFKVPGRGYYIARGPLSAALETVYGATVNYRSASIWWPDDRAWCVATEVDFDWTYVGGSNECVAAVLGHPDLEALPARISDGVSYASDPINPKPLA